MMQLNFNLKKQKLNWSDRLTVKYLAHAEFFFLSLSVGWQWTCCEAIPVPSEHRTEYPVTSLPGSAQNLRVRGSEGIHFTPAWPQISVNRCMKWGDTRPGSGVTLVLQLWRMRVRHCEEQKPRWSQPLNSHSLASLQPGDNGQPSQAHCWKM